MPHVELGEGVRLFFTDDGPKDAEPLLLVHGYAADAGDWSWHISGLSESYRVIAPDLRGHGHSSAPATGYRPEDLARDLAGLLDHLGIERTVAIGHSMGAMVVSALAVEHAPRIKALVCVDPAYGQNDTVAQMMPGLVEALRKDAYEAVLAMESALYTPATPEVVRTAHARKAQATSEAALRQCFPALFTDDGAWGLRAQSEAYLSGRECPVLTCWASPEPAAWESGLFKHPASRAVAWPAAGHRLHEERPAEFLLAVTTWLNKLDLQDT
jgi:pimeloyl-ACP methyl ester carboxylesterase